MKELFGVLRASLPGDRALCYRKQTLLHLGKPFRPERGGRDRAFCCLQTAHLQRGTEKLASEPREVSSLRSQPDHIPELEQILSCLLLLPLLYHCLINSFSSCHFFFFSPWQSTSYLLLFMPSEVLSSFTSSRSLSSLGEEEPHRLPY